MKKVSKRGCGGEGVLWVGRKLKGNFGWKVMQSVTLGVKAGCELRGHII